MTEIVSALAELEQLLKDYEVGIEPVTMGKVLLSIMVDKGPVEIQQWFNQLALDLHRARNH